MRMLRSRPYRADLESLFSKYACALDHTDFDVTFLKLWGLLEKMTDTVGQDYKKTIDRATWHSRDNEIDKNLLEYLRLRRNLYVHSARSSLGPDQVAQKAKTFVDRHLAALVKNQFKVQSLEEYGKILDLPRDKEKLTERRRALDRIIKVLES